MHPDRSSLILAYGFAAAIGSLAAFVTWRRDAAAGRPLALMLLSGAFWAFCDVLEMSVTTVQGKRLVSQVQYLSVISAVPLFFHSALALSRLEKYLNRTVLLAVWGIPVITLGMAWTSNWHTLLWKAIVIPDPATNIAVYVYGWWFWVLTAQNYILMATGTAILLRTALRIRAFRKPMLVLVIGMLFPWLGNIAYVFKLGPWLGVNWLSISMCVSGIMLFWSTLYGGLLDLLPAAREALVERMADGVVVLDHTGRVSLNNSTARAMFGWNKEPDRERDRTAVLPEAIAQHLQDPRFEDWHGEVEHVMGDIARWLDVRVSALHDRWGEIAGRLLVIRDITVQRGLQQEKERMITELKAVLAEVQMLKGLLPMCANCKKIRDDQGYWKNVDLYLSDHSELKFTHGICPECIRKLYPEHVKPTQ